MIFNRHSHLEGQHAFLGASKYHWINYDEDKLAQSYINFLATQRGTELHALAYDCIRLGVKLPRTKDTLNMYVNDAIGFKMTPELTLHYSDNCFGTTDALCYRNKVLRIHDLKTGVSPTSMRQLEIYAAIFCLEYKVDPHDIRVELRIYQSDEVIVHEPDSNSISTIMDKIIVSDKLLEKMRSEM